jgi:hypothetical protein
MTYVDFFMDESQSLEAQLKALLNEASLKQKGTPSYPSTAQQNPDGRSHRRGGAF